MSNKISGYQLAIILYLCRSYTTLTHTTGEQNTMVVIYAIIIGVIFQLLLLLPAYFLHKKYRSTNIISITKNASPKLAFVLGVLTSFYCIFIAFDTFTTFFTFMTSTVFPYTDQFTLIFWMLLLVIYAVILGLHPILRTSVLIFPFTLLTLFIIYGFSIREVNFIYWKPILESPVASTLKYSVLISLRNFELIPLIYLLDYVTKNKKGTILTYIIGFSIIQELRMLSILLILGDYAKAQLYPSYALASLVQASIFQRLDSLYTIIWVFMAFIRLSLYLWLSINVLKQVFPKKFHPYFLPLTSLLLFVSTMWKNTFYTTESFNLIYQISTTILVILLIIIPLLLLTPLIFTNRRVKQ